MFSNKQVLTFILEAFLFFKNHVFLSKIWILMLAVPLTKYMVISSEPQFPHLQKGGIIISGGRSENEKIVGIISTSVSVS